MLGGVGKWNRVEVMVGGVGIVVKIGRVGNGIRSGSMETSVWVSILVSDSVGAVGIVVEIDDEIRVVSLVVEIIGGVGSVDELDNTSFVVVVADVTVGSVGISFVVETMHSSLPVLMHEDENSWKTHPKGHGRSSK